MRGRLSATSAPPLLPVFTRPPDAVTPSSRIRGASTPLAHVLKALGLRSKVSSRRGNGRAVFTLGVLALGAASLLLLILRSLLLATHRAGAQLFAGPAPSAAPGHVLDAGGKSRTHTGLPDWSARPRPASEEELARLLEAVPATVSSMDKQRAIAGMISWAWRGYAEHAFGSDDLKPLSKGGHQWVHLGATIVDALDTLLIAGLTDEYSAARHWVVNDLNLDADHGVFVNTFETTIRVLGGLLSAHHLTPGGDPDVLAKALDLAPRLGVACNATATGIPLSDVNLASRTAKAPAWTTDASVAEAATLSLEYVAASAAAHTTAAQKAGSGVADADPLGWLADAGLKAQSAVVQEAARAGNGLVTHKFISTQDGGFRGDNVITLGARVDSTYEYLLKGWLHTGKSADGEPLLVAYQDAVHGVTTQLLARVPGQDYLYIAEKPQGTGNSPKMDHLVCFWPGLVALGHSHGVTPRPEQQDAQEQALQSLGLPPEATQLDIAQLLAAGCRAMYAANPLGMGPEIAYFDGTSSNQWGVNIHPGDAHSLLRPEYLESLFYLWRLTGNSTYRDWGWDAAMAIQRHARVPTGGYASVSSVLSTPPQLRDHMESFFLAETLKYLYLLFDDSDTIDLDAWVFNTEAHPLPVVGPRMRGALKAW